MFTDEAADFSSGSVEEEGEEEEEEI